MVWLPPGVVGTVREPDHEPLAAAVTPEIEVGAPSQSTLIPVSEVVNPLTVTVIAEPTTPDPGLSVMLGVTLKYIGLSPVVEGP